MTCGEEIRSQSLIFRSEDELEAIALRWSIHQKTVQHWTLASAGLFRDRRTVGLLDDVIVGLIT